MDEDHLYLLAAKEENTLMHVSFAGPGHVGDPARIMFLDGPLKGKWVYIYPSEIED